MKYMDQSATAKSYDLLAARLLLIEDKINEGFKNVIDKINPLDEKKYLTDQDLLELFQITRAVREKLIAKNILRPIKLNGSRSTSLYLRGEVESSLLEHGRLNPKMSAC
ncbi:MAG: hypothetical protein ACJATI_004728 [Halioglobus sp.]|jgi:hypothetical protein